MTSTGSGATPSATNSIPEERALPGGLLQAARHVLRGVECTLLAPECAVCERVLDGTTRGPVCAQCWSTISPALGPQCLVCGAPVAPGHLPAVSVRCGRCLDATTPLTCVRACGAYEDVLEVIIRRLKYDRHVSLAYRLADLMRASGSAVLAGADAVVPVPLHPLRRLYRGFNQSGLIARHLGLPVVQALRRTRWTDSQTRLSAGGRQRNMRRAFRARTRHDIAGRTLVLVDDVRTTGATLDACAGVLREAGAAEVRGLVVARADLQRQRARAGQP